MNFFKRPGIVVVVQIKNKLMRGLLYCGASCVSLLRKVQIKNTKPRSLLIPAVPYPGSLGDEAMVLAAISTIRDRIGGQQGILTPASHEDWGVDELVTVENIGVAGVINYFDLTLWRFLILLIKYDNCFVLGADVLDGGHGDGHEKLLLMGDIAARAGLQSTVLGCSINENPTRIMRSAWLRVSPLLHICARDPLSLQRLTKLCRHKPKLVADVAFLMVPRKKSEVIESFYQWKKQQSTALRFVLGINMSGYLMKMLMKKEPARFVNEMAYLELMASVIESLHHLIPNLSLVLVPHDRRSVASDVVLNDLLKDRLLGEFGNHLFHLPSNVLADEVKCIIASSSLVITGRMHLAIAALGQGVPCIGLDYQGKFEGLFSYFGIEDLCITIEFLAHASLDEIVAKVYSSLQESEQLKNRITLQLPRVRNLALKNFE